MSIYVNSVIFDYCFRKKALYFKRGKKNQTAMKKQKLFCTLRWGNFLSENHGNCAGQKRSHFVVLFWPYFLSNQSGIWYTIVFWSEFFEYAKRNCVSTLVFFYNLFKKIYFFEYMGVGISASNWATELIKKPKESSWPT